MKAKDLIKILETNPDADVAFLGFNGYDMELSKIQSATQVAKDEIVSEVIDDDSLLTVPDSKAKNEIFLIRVN